MVTIAKALKIKNRVAEKLRKAEQEFKRINSYRKDLGVDASQLDAWTKLLDLREEMWRLKAEIAKANTPIQDAIFEMAELKAEISFLGTLPTTNGKVVVSSNRYSLVEDVDSEKFVEYVAFLTRQQVEDRVEELQEKLDELQEKLDYFNNTTKINVKVLGA
jgi:peptidoglycan hydrolase CwlO-like protein